MTINLQLPAPVSSNRYWRTRIVTPRGGEPFVSTYVSAEAKQFKETVGWLARQAGVRAPLGGHIAIEYVLHPKRPQDWRTRARKDPIGWEDTVQCIDLDNATKVLLDALTGIVIEDDRWVRRILAERGAPVQDGGIVLRVAQIALPAKPVQEALSL